MRVVKEIHIDGIRISVYSWNNKYLLKYEQGLIEQTYKVNEMEISSEDDLSAFFTGNFLEYIKKNFQEMHLMLNTQLKNV